MPKSPFIRAIRIALVAISLAASLAIAAMMVRGLFVSDLWDRLSLDRQRRVARLPEVFAFTSGVVAYSVQRRAFDARVLQTRYSGQEMVYGVWDGRWHYNPQKPTRHWRAALLGFRVSRQVLTLRPGEVITATSIALPLWFPLVLTAIGPARVLMRWKRHRSRRKHGCCPDCGYDLRASSDRCPECGAPAIGAKASAASDSPPS
jgi:hypothetical protein